MWRENRTESCTFKIRYAKLKPTMAIATGTINPINWDKQMIGIKKKRSFVMGIVDPTRTTERKVIWKRQHQTGECGDEKRLGEQGGASDWGPDWRNKKKETETTPEDWRVSYLSHRLGRKRPFLFYQEKAMGRATTRIIIEWRIDLWSEPRRVPRKPQEIGKPQRIFVKTTDGPKEFPWYRKYRVRGAAK